MKKIYAFTRVLIQIFNGSVKKSLTVHKSSGHLKANVRLRFPYQINRFCAIFRFFWNNESRGRWFKPWSAACDMGTARLLITLLHSNADTSAQGYT